MFGNLKKISEVEAVSHQGRPKPRVAVRPLQSRVSKFRLSWPLVVVVRNADYLLVRCANSIRRIIHKVARDN
jgi:hypothetical protein